MKAQRWRRQNGKLATKRESLVADLIGFALAAVRVAGCEPGVDETRRLLTDGAIVRPEGVSPRVIEVTAEVVK